MSTQLIYKTNAYRCFGNLYLKIIFYGAACVGHGCVVVWLADAYFMLRTSVYPSAHPTQKNYELNVGASLVGARTQNKHNVRRDLPAMSEQETYPIVCQANQFFRRDVI